jgi:hypothetical protein
VTKHSNKIPLGGIYSGAKTTLQANATFKGKDLPAPADLSVDLSSTGDVQVGGGGAYANADSEGVVNAGISQHIGPTAGADYSVGTDGLGFTFPGGPPISVSRGLSVQLSFTVTYEPTHPQWTGGDEIFGDIVAGIAVAGCGLAASEAGPEASAAAASAC